LGLLQFLIDLYKPRMNSKANIEAYEATTDHAAISTNLS